MKCVAVFMFVSPTLTVPDKAVMGLGAKCSGRRGLWAPKRKTVQHSKVPQTAFVNDMSRGFDGLSKHRWSKVLENSRPLANTPYLIEILRQPRVYVTGCRGIAQQPPRSLHRLKY